jgi:hypothetical protein
LKNLLPEPIQHAHNASHQAAQALKRQSSHKAHQLGLFDKA